MSGLLLILVLGFAGGFGLALAEGSKNRRRRESYRAPSVESWEDGA